VVWQVSRNISEKFVASVFRLKVSHNGNVAGYIKEEVGEYVLLWPEVATHGQRYGS
jgi:hypothetical protein